MNNTLSSYRLNIAEIIFLIKSENPNILLATGEGSEFFIDDKNTNAHVFINVSRGAPDMSSYNLIFDSPEQEDGKKLWTIYGNGNNYCIVSNPEDLPHTQVFAFFDDTMTDWKLFFNSEDEVIIADPFSYPLGPLIMMYASSVFDSIMMHASAVTLSGKTFLFCGFSGRGKTTISEIFKNAGAVRINDDRVLIRKQGNQFIVHNTPMLYKDRKRQAEITACFEIYHNKENHYQQLGSLQSIATLSAFCLQHNFIPELINRRLELLFALCNHVQIGKLGFFPCEKVVEFVNNCK